MLHACREQIFVCSWWKTPKDKDHLEEKVIDEEIILIRIVNK